MAEQFDLERGWVPIDSTEEKDTDQAPPTGRCGVCGVPGVDSTHDTVCPECFEAIKENGWGEMTGEY